MAKLTAGSSRKAGIERLQVPPEGGSHNMTSVSAHAHQRWYQFGPYVIDRRSRLLWRNGTLVPLTAKAFEILAVLIEHRQRIVDKNELLDTIWPKTAVEENTLTRHISTLRKALEEQPGHHHYILTVPGHGYQFVEDVVELDERPEHLRDSITTPPTGMPAMVPMPALQPVGSSALAVTATPPNQVTTRFARPVAAITFILAIAVVGGVVVTLRAPRMRPPTVGRVLRQVTFQAGLQREPAFSPDGRFVAYTSSERGNSDIWVQATAEPTPNRIVSSPSEDSQPDWSPDGQSIVFRSERDGGGLYVVPATGGTERKIANFGYQPRWSADGSLVLFSSSGRPDSKPKLYVVETSGGTPRPVRSDLTQKLAPVTANWKPGGHDVSFWGRSGGKWTFLTATVDDGEPIVSSIAPEVQRRIDTAGLVLGRFSWSRSGRFLYFEGVSQGVRNLWRITVAETSLDWIDGPDRLTTGTGEDRDIAVSPDDTRLVFSARSLQTRLWSFPFDAVSGHVIGAGEPLTSGGAGEQDAEALRDGTKLVYSATRGGRQEIWERSIVERRDRLVLVSNSWLSRPHWSPDGTRLAYAKRRNGTDISDAVVAVLSVKDGSEHFVSKPGIIRFLPSDWSADGTRLIGGCPQGAERPVAICVLDVSTTATTQQTSARTIATHPTHNLFEQRFSPDQRWISFMAVDRGDNALATVYVMPAAGGEWRAVTDGKAYDDKPHWSPDGRTIYFASDRGGLWNVWGRHFDPETGLAIGDPFRVTSFDSPRQTLATQLTRMQFAISADRLFLPLTETSGELWMLENVDR